MAEVAIIMVTHNSAGFIGPCLSSVVPSGADIVVVDNSSTDETREIIRQYPGVRLIETGTNFGYGKAINLGAAQTHSGHKHLILSNTDVVYREGTVSTMISFLESHPEIGITAPRQVSPSGGWQRSYGDIPGVWTGIKDVLGISSAIRWYRRLCWPRRVDSRPKQVGYVFGAVLALPREAYLQAKGFDEDFYFYGDESDLCIRLRKMGWKVVFCPFAEVIHHGGGDSTRLDQSDKFYRFLTKSHAMLAKKHLPLWQARAYVWLEKLYFQRLALGFKLIKRVSRANSSKDTRLDHRIWVMDVCTRLLAEQLSQLGASEPKAGSLGAC